ncbi:hypothetical protein [Solirubrobacter soli]|uniref:hypothetical protein n=1 Tax=Solirubrobacter soli TaxID=363832 RepID=UPI000487C77E|nr:hypothetical protein [Solirubrobacter soli]
MTPSLEPHENGATRERRRHRPPDQLAKDGPAPAQPAPAALLLAVQRGAGNQAAGRLARRREQAPATLAPPFTVGSIVSGDFMVTVEIAAQHEVGDGWETEQEAAVAAASGGQIGVVVQDAEGRLRAFETDMVPFDSPAHSVPAMLPVGRVVRFARVSSPKEPMSWLDQQAYIRDLNGSGEPERVLLARRMLCGLLVSEVGLRADDVNDSTEGGPLAGKVNVNIDLADARGHAGKPGPVPCDRTTPLEEPMLEIGPLAFNNPISLRGTVLHEFEHIHHTEKAIEAVGRWRATEPRDDFPVWLDKQLKRGKISALDHGVIREQVSSGTEATESLAYLTGFMATYHLRPLDDIELFTSLVHLADEWPRAGHAVQEETITQLLAYREGLETPHKDALDAFVAPRRTELFWNRLP